MIYECGSRAELVEIAASAECVCECVRTIPASPPPPLGRPRTVRPKWGGAVVHIPCTSAHIEPINRAMPFATMCATCDDYIYGAHTFGPDARKNRDCADCLRTRTSPHVCTHTHALRCNCPDDGKGTPDLMS